MNTRTPQDPTTTTTATILVAHWDDGVHVFRDAERRHELAARAVRALARDAVGRALAIVDDHLLCRRETTGEWIELARSDASLACVVAVGPHVYVGTDDARVLALHARGAFEPLGSFDAVEGRASWFAGGAMIDGVWMGPPLGVRSLTATADGATLLANVHVGGIPRTTDGGTTWHATIAIDSDVHQVLAHPTDPHLVIAATAMGLAMSEDGGRTWALETAGLAALHCSAVMFAGADVLVSAAPDHFAAHGAVYRRPIVSRSVLAPISFGLTSHTNGIVDTGCIDAQGTTLAIADRGGNLHLSSDGGSTWSRHAQGLAPPSSILVI